MLCKIKSSAKKDEFIMSQKFKKALNKMMSS